MSRLHLSGESLNKKSPQDSQAASGQSFLSFFAARDFDRPTGTHEENRRVWALWRSVFEHACPTCRDILFPQNLADRLKGFYTFPKAVLRMFRQDVWGGAKGAVRLTAPSVFAEEYPDECRGTATRRSDGVTVGCRNVPREARPTPSPI